jgi:hypothetical protein
MISIKSGEIWMQKEIEDSIFDDATKLDEINYQIGDTLDVKASIIFVVLTFLATMSGQILAIPGLPPPVKYFQLASILLLIIAGAFTILALWPRVFDVPPDPEESAKYSDKLEEKYKGRQDAVKLVRDAFIAAWFKNINERIARNRRIALRKAKLNKWALRAVVLATGLELASLSLLALRYF